MDGVADITISLLLEKVLSVQAQPSGSYSQVSASVLLIWDIIITCDQEIQLIWRSNRSFVKYIFLFIRYGTLIQVVVSNIFLLGDVETDKCRASLWGNALTCLVIIWGVDILLAYRAFAFCGRDKRIMIGLVVLSVLSCGASLALAVLFVQRFGVIHNSIAFVRGVFGVCDATSFPTLLRDLWISELIFHSILFILVSGRFVQLTITSWKNPARISTLCLIFIRDGVWAYALLFGVFITSVFQTTVAGLSIIQWALGFSVIASNRMILNLRGTSSANLNSPSYNIATETGFSFGTMPREPQSHVLFPQSSDDDLT